MYLHIQPSLAVVRIDATCIWILMISLAGWGRGGGSERSGGNERCTKESGFIEEINWTRSFQEGKEFGSALGGRSRDGLGELCAANTEGARET